MIKLKKIIENTDYSSDSDEWDSWTDYLENFDYLVTNGELLKLIKKNNLQYQSYFKDNVIKINDDKSKVYLQYDKKNETFDVIKDIGDWIYNIASNGLSDIIDVDTIWNGFIESTLNNMKKNPGLVYHWTDGHRWELIQFDGILKGSSGTGLYNRHTHGIFTSVNPEEYANGTYGDVCLKIDLQAFKTENLLPLLNLEYEPEVTEYLIREYLIAKLELENDMNNNIPSDTSPYTIIVKHKIPLKYVSQL